MSTTATKDLQKTAERLTREGRFPEAINALERWLAAEPLSAPAHARLGGVLRLAGNLPRAENVLRKALELQAQPDSETLAHLGKVLAGLHKFSESQTALKAALDTGSNDNEVFYLLGMALAGYNNTEEALPLLRRAAKAYPDDPNLHHVLAFQLFKRGSLNEARSIALRAAELNPKDAGYWALLARTATELKEYEEANRAFHQSVRLKLDQSNLIDDWDSMLNSAFSAEEVLAHFADAASKTPDDIPALLQLARHLNRSGRWQEALQTIDQCLLLAPNSNVAHECRARVLLALGDFTNAISAFHGLWERGFAAVHNSPSHPPYPASIFSPAKTAKISPIVYIPVEIKSRELGARLLTACAAADRGMTSVLAPALAITAGVLDELPPGILFNKTLNSIDAQKALAARNAGHLVASADEEGLGWLANPEIIVAGNDPDIMKVTDVIFVPGQHHADAYRQAFPDSPARIVVTGNARIDFYQPPLNESFSREIAEIREKHGDAILICTNFGGINSAVASYTSLVKMVFTLANQDSKSAQGRVRCEVGKAAVEAECLTFMACHDLLRRLTEEMPETPIVVRTHPGESATYWRQKFQSFGNITFTTEGSLPAWLLASRVVVYMAGCATGFEAALIGARAIRFHAREDLKIPSYALSSLLNTPATTIDEIITLCKKWIHEDVVSDAILTEQHNLIGRHILMDGGLAADRIASELKCLYESCAITGGAARNIVETIEETLQLQNLAEARREKPRLAANKLFTVSQEEVEGLIRTFSDKLGRFSDCSVRIIDNQAVIIGPAIP